MVFGKTSSERSPKEVFFGILKLFNILTTSIHKFSATRARKKYLILIRPIIFFICIPIFYVVPNITKQSLIQEIAKSTGFVRSDIKTVVEQFLELVGEKLVDGNTIEIRGFGTFACKPRKARPARNPRTGETVLIDERLVPTFKFSNDIKDKINSLDMVSTSEFAPVEQDDEDEVLMAMPRILEEDDDE